MDSTLEEYDAQKAFDQKYITSREIMEELDITGPTLFSARKRNLLPQPIVVNHLYIWERELIAENLAAWKRLLLVRRGG